MISLTETIQESLALVHKAVAMQKKVSRRLDVKRTVTECIKSMLEIYVL